MTNSIEELGSADVLLVTGSNTTETHPQIGRNILEAVDAGAKLIVIDPRRTDLAREAHIHLNLRPGTDIALINCMMRIILDEDLADDQSSLTQDTHHQQLRCTVARVTVPGSPHGAIQVIGRYVWHAVVIPGDGQAGRFRLFYVKFH